MIHTGRAEPGDLRRRLVWYPLLAVMLVVVVTGRADASHISEPLRPIATLRLDLYRYPDRTSLLRCDGSAETFRFPVMRIEPIITLAAWPQDPAAPSEHWITRVVVNAPISPNSNRQSKLWDEEWFHQNTRPHPFAAFEVAQGNTYRMFDLPGRWTVNVTVTGMESGVVLSKSCSFTVVP